MKKILLTSYLGGIESQFVEYSLVNKITDKEILYIPTAGNVEEYTGYIDDGIEMLENLGYKLKMLDISNESETKCYREISEARVIWVSGGNTFYLLQEIKNKNLVSVLKKQINDGCLYIGESAGAIILSKNIEYCKAMDSVFLAPSLNDYIGLDEIDFYPLPHYIEEPFVEPVKQIFKDYNDKLNLIPINNEQAIFVDGGKVEIK